jgi:hypothetical protein
MALEKMSSQPRREIISPNKELLERNDFPRSLVALGHDGWAVSGSHSFEADLAFAQLKRERALQLDANHNTIQDRNPGVNVSANAASPDKLLESMLGDAGEPAAPFGLTRDKPRAVKRAILELDRDLANRLRERAALLDVNLESLVCLTWSLILSRFSGQDRVTFGAALPPFTKVFPVRIDAVDRPAETACGKLMNC